MLLEYLWIEEYKGFKNISFNFGGEYEYDYLFETEKLNIKNNINYKKDFFNTSDKEETCSVKNITGIVGVNGAGKTTLLNLIKENLISGFGGIKINMIVVFEKDNSHYVYHDENINLQHEKLNKYIYRSYKIDENKLGDGFTQINYPEIEELKDVIFVYFSNIFDGSYEDSYGNLMNLSTNFLIRNYKKEQIENKVISLYDNVGEVETFKIEEVFRQLIFLNNNMDIIEKMKIKKPNYLELIAVDYCSASEENNRKKMSSYYEIIMMIKRNIIKIEHLESSLKEEILIIKFYESIIFCFLLELADEEKTFKIEIESVQNLWEICENTRGLMDNMENFISAFADGNIGIKRSDEWKEFIKEKAFKIKELMKITKRIIRKNKDNNNFLNHGYTIVPVDYMKSKDDLQELINLYREIMVVNPIFKFNWHAFSSGEKAMLNIYSRFYFNVTDKFNKEKMKSKHFVILIDEGETYLHPQWQKQFIFRIISFMNLMFENKMIHIILTSNTPMLLSDLPSGNVIFLNKNNDGSVTNGNFGEEQKTFAANIHSLYSKSFFLEDGLIGDFAKFKVNKIIHWLINGDYNVIQDNKKEIELIIRIIGEPILQNKLTNMLENKLKRDCLDVEGKIKDLQEQINDLRDRYDKNQH